MTNDLPLFSSCLPSQRKRYSFSYNQQSLDVWIFADVLFGSPKRRCAGQGICKVEVLAGNAPPMRVRDKCNYANAILCITDHGTADLYFIKASLCSKLIRQYFVESYLELEEPVEMELRAYWDPARAAQGLRSKQALSKRKHCLLPGRYVIKDLMGFYYIEFEIRKV